MQKANQGFVCSNLRIPSINKNKMMVGSWREHDEMQVPSSQPTVNKKRKRRSTHGATFLTVGNVASWEQPSYSSFCLWQVMMDVSIHWPAATFHVQGIETLACKPPWLAWIGCLGETAHIVASIHTSQWLNSRRGTWNGRFSGDLWYPLVKKHLCYPMMGRGSVQATCWFIDSAFNVLYGGWFFLRPGIHASVRKSHLCIPLG